MRKGRAHFIGIAGKGMSAVAKLLQDQGWQISGSDAEFYPPVSDYLRRHHLPLSEGYGAENIPAGADLIIIGKNAKLVPETNEEVRAAFASGAAVRSFPEVLHDLAENTHNIVVAGSYGKSTVTALLSFCLAEAGNDPSYFIGEIVRGMEEHARIGKGRVFVLEGDEYPSANWDATSKFLYYRPRDIILTAAAHDHVNVFPTQADFDRPFRQLIALMPPEGLLLACANEPNALRLARQSGREVVLYGLTSQEAVWSARGINYGERTHFTLTRGGEPVVGLTTRLLGRHNIENIVAAAALLLERELIAPAALESAVARFAGVKRRMELLTETSPVPVFEGFGSSYDKAVSALAAVRLHFPARRIVVVFEPHTFSWRSRDKLHWYDDVFKGAGLVLIYHPAAQGADTHAQATHAEIVERVRNTGIDAHAITTPSEALALLDREVAPQDVVLILTSGGLDGMIETIPALVERKFAA